jgi:hypothetical protein
MAGAGLALTVGLAAAPVLAQQQQQLSDRSVQWYMNRAFEQLLPAFTKPDGERVVIDKKQKDQIMIPVEDAREIIYIARRSYRAQLCGLQQEQADNYRAMQAREQAKRKWTKQQGIYIMTLHLTVVQLMTGTFKLVEKDGDKIVKQEEVPSKVIKPCTDEERAKLKEEIVAYVKASPELSTAAADGPPAVPAATGSTTVAKPTSDKK